MNADGKKFSKSFFENKGRCFYYKNNLRYFVSGFFDNKERKYFNTMVVKKKKAVKKVVKKVAKKPAKKAKKK